MKLLSGQKCTACGAANAAALSIRTRAHCQTCGVAFKYTWRYYVLIFICGMSGGYAGNLVQILFGTDNLFVTIAILLPTLWVFVTVVWHIVPGLVVADAGSGNSRI